MCVCFIYVAIASAAYEKACVLFAIAAMQTQVASCQDLKTDDGLKMAAKLFQVGLLRLLHGVTIGDNLGSCLVCFRLCEPFSALTLLLSLIHI